VIVVGDASIFIALERIGAQSLLPDLYTEVHVPEAVWREILRSDTPPPAWIVRHSLPLPLPLVTWPEQLDEGETEAIHLAHQLAADLLLIDEAAGRAVARRIGLEISGTVGVLIEARRQGKLAAVKPLLDRLRQSGFWLSAQVYQSALKQAGE
jgi:uncharacterized protein